MAGNKVGGQQAAKTNIKRYGKNFYKRIGKIGGQARGMKGFAVNIDLARKAGSIGGKRGKRGYRIVQEDPSNLYYLDIKTGESVVVRK